MEEAYVPLTRSQFTCSVCLELLKDPTTIPCGHNFCLSCIKVYWDRRQEERDEDISYSCPQCRQTFSSKPVLGRNLVIAQMVDKLRYAGMEDAPDQDELVPADVLCTACVGRKRKANRSCFECLASYCETHFQQHEELQLGKRHKVVEAMANLEEMICSTHNKPLEVWCQTDEMCICPLCIIDNHKDHDIITAAAAKSEKQSKLSKRFEEEIAQREKELTWLQQTVEPYKLSTKGALQASEKFFTTLMALLQEKSSELKEMIRLQEQTQLSEVDQLESKYQQRISLLKDNNAELAKLALTEDCIHFLQRLPSLCLAQDFCGVYVGSLAYFDNVKASLSVEQQKDSLKKQFDVIARQVKNTFIGRMNRKELLQYFCQPKLDKNTCFRHHNINQNGTTIDWSHISFLYDDKERFDVCRQVLCTTGFSGRHYWEVECSLGVSIAVAYKTIKRKGSNCSFGSNDQSWSLNCSKSPTFSHNGIKAEIPYQTQNRIGVYLDHKAGILDFYSVSEQEASLLHRVGATFTQPVYPGFYFSCGQSLEICSYN